MIALPVTLVLALATAQDAAPATPTVRAAVDRPAMWVGDRITYTVAIDCPRGVDILTGGLAREKLKLTGFEVISGDSSRQEGSDEIRYVFRYVLTTYRVDVPSPSVAAFPVRYFFARAGQPPEQAAPAGSVTVPGISVAWRSLLPDDQPADVRDGRVIPPRWLPFRVLGLVGLGLIVAAMVPAVLMTVDLVRRVRARQPRTRPSGRQSRVIARASVEELRALDPLTSEARRAAFARLDAAVRQHVDDVCGIATAGLTPEEVARAIEPCAARLPSDLVVALLDTAERARYAPLEGQPSAEDWQAAVSRAEELLARRR